MDLWVNLLFGNWIGILSMATIFGTLSIGAFVLTLLYRKSHSDK
jgi:hypothetical protein